MNTSCFNSPRRVAFALACVGFLFSSPDSRGATDPVGYEFVTIHGNTYSLVAQRLLPTTAAVGIVTAVAGADVTASGIDFDSILTPGIPYVLELNGPSHRVIDIVSYSLHTLTLAESGIVSVDDLFRVRPFQKLSRILSPVDNPDLNPVEDFNPDTGDLILIPDGSGGFSQYFYSSFPGYEGFFNAGTGVAEDPFIRYTDSLLFLRRGSGFGIVLSGEIKLTDTAIPISQRFSPISCVNPFATLDEIGLAETLLPGNSVTRGHCLVAGYYDGRISPLVLFRRQRFRPNDGLASLG